MSHLRIGMFIFVLLVSDSALQADQCPDGLPPDATCYSGVDANGAFYLIAVPANYNHRLVLWNHGYDLNPPHELGATDLDPASRLLPLGYAAAASSYRPDSQGLGGWAVADGAEDTENLRQFFVSQVGPPDQTIVIGASEGGLVTAAIIEEFGSNPDGTLNYNGALQLCGPLAGGRRNWYGGFDLRTVYQYYCQNLPYPDEPQYPLYYGLDPNSTIDQAEVIRRIDECTGVRLPPDRRTPEQGRNLMNILGVTHVPEDFLLTDMFFATYALEELVLGRTLTHSPVTNLGVTYTGSDDDAALNQGVYRHGSDEEGRRFIISAYDPTGNVLMPTVNMHTIGDGLVIVENENAYREILQDAGHADNLLQTYVNANGHCEFSGSEFGAVFLALQNWVNTGARPTQDQIVGLCEGLGGPCNFNTTFEPNPFNSRVADREP
jgi:hypothetical protein